MACHFPQNIHVCLGGLFVPEAYITATRQYVAQANSWSLEELCLEVNVTTSQSAALDACSFGVTGECLSLLGDLSPSTCSLCEHGTRVYIPMFTLPPAGLKLQGATCSNNKLSLSNAISTVLPLTQLRWVKQTNAEKKASVVSGQPSQGGFCRVRAQQTSFLPAILQVTPPMSPWLRALSLVSTSPLPLSCR